MQVGIWPAGKGAGAVQLLDAAAGQAQLRQAGGQADAEKEGKQLAAGLAGQLIAPQAFLQPQLHQDAKAHFFAVELTMAGGQLGEPVMHGVGGHGAAAGTAHAADHSGSERTGLSHPHPGVAGLVGRTRGGQGDLRLLQQLVAQHPRHLHCLLDQAIATAGTAHGSLIPLGHGIGNATGQGAAGGAMHQAVVKDQQVGAALQGHVAAEGPLGGIEIGEGGPAGAGGGTGGHGDAGQPQAIGQ